MLKARLNKATKAIHCHYYTTIRQSFPPIHTQTIKNMNLKQNKAKKRQDMQNYTFINIKFITIKFSIQSAIS